MSKMQWWADMHALRKHACNSAIADVLRAAMEETGDEVPANYRFRDARDDDKWLVRKEAVELHCPALDNHPGMVIMALWQIRGPLFLELIAQAETPQEASAQCQHSTKTGGSAQCHDPMEQDVAGASEAQAAASL